MRRSRFASSALIILSFCSFSATSLAQDEPPPQDRSFGSSPDDRRVNIQVTDEEGKPVRRVKLWLELDHPRFPSVNDDLARRTAFIHTNDKGIASVWYPAKPAAVVVSAKGYATQFLRNAELTKQDPFPVRLSTGQPIRGRLLMIKGEPAGNAQVIAEPTDTPWSHLFEFEMRGRTAADGTFKLPHAAALDYRVKARIEDEQSPAFVEPVIVKVTAEAPPAPVEMAAKPGAAVVGTIISVHNVRVGGLGVEVSTSGTHHDAWQISTRPDGSFAVLGIPPTASGDIRLEVPQAYVPEFDLPAELGFIRQEGYALKFDGLPPGRHEGVVIRLLKEAIAEGVVRDQDGKPVAGLRVVVRPSNRLAQTDDEGRYRAPLPPDRDVSLEFKKDLNDPVLAAATVRAGEGQKVEKDVVITRVAERKMDGEISGQVVYAEGKPAGGATVFLGNYGLIPRDAENRADGMNDGKPRPNWRSGHGSSPIQLTADDEGRFNFNFLYPGKTDLWAETKIGEVAWAADVATGSKDLTLRLAPSPQTFDVTGNVADAGGKPVAGARLVLFTWDPEPDEKPLAEARSGPDGRFSLRASPPWRHHKTLRLICVSDGHALAWRSLPRLGVDGVELRLKDSAVVTGRALLAKGKPAPGAVARARTIKDLDYGHVFLTDGLAAVAPSAVAGEDGSFTLRGLPRGCTASLTVKHSESGTATVNETHFAEARGGVGDVALPPGITLEGTVTFAHSGAPAAGATVKVGSYRTSGTARTDGDGRYRLTGLDRLNTHDEYTLVSASAGGEPPEWEGRTRFAGKPVPGDRVTGVDVVLARSFGSLHQEWLSRHGEPMRGRFGAAVLHDADPAYNGKRRFEDTLTLYDAGGNVAWRYAGLNISQSIGGDHPVAYNAADGSIWVCENVGDRLLNLTTGGKLAWEVPAVKGHSVAIDPKTGNGWVVTSEGTIYGKSVIVFSRAGEKLRELNVGGHDIAYGPKEDCFWLVGKTLQKLDRQGNVLAKADHEFPWVATGVSVDEMNGMVWVVEGEHSQVKGSTGKVIVYAPNTERLAEFAIDGRAVAVDPRRNFVWACSYDGLTRLTADARLDDRFPLKASDVCVEPDTGYVWAATTDGVYRLDPSGRPVWQDVETGKSQKWVCLVPLRGPG